MRSDGFVSRTPMRFQRTSFHFPVVRFGVGLLLAALAGVSHAANVSVVKSGTGSGTVVADVGSINCGGACADVLPSNTVLTLLATPDVGSQFVGWLGPCTGAGPCLFTTSTDTTVVAGFAPTSLGTPRLDVDGNGAYDALTDGLLTLRHLFGLTGPEMVAGAIGAGASRSTPAEVNSYLGDIKPALDIDGDGRADALTDGLLLVRYLFGIRGNALVTGAVTPGAPRSSAEAIETQMLLLAGLSQTIQFTSIAPAGAVVGGAAYIVAAVATSGLPVTFAIDPAAASVCTISGLTVSFIAAGTCIVNANQAGDATYGPAPRVQQSFAVQSGSGSSIYSTVFPGIENPISEGGKWINGGTVGLDWNDVQSLAGAAFGSVTVGSYNDDIAVLTTSFPANQYVQATVRRVAGYSPPVSHEIELLLRFKISAHTARGYEVLWAHGGELNVVRWNGAISDFTLFGPIGGYGPNIGSASDGDVVRAEIAGNQISVYVNGDLKLQVDISSQGGTVYTDGQPGIGFWPTTGATPTSYGWKNYQAGGL